MAAPLPGADTPLLEAAPSPTGLLQPVVGSLAGTADHLIAAVPLVNSAVPAGTVASVAVPVAAVVDLAADDLLDTVAPPLVEAVPVLEPVLQPVVRLVDATVAELPVAPAVLPGLSIDGIAVATDAASITEAAAGPVATAEHTADNAPGRSPGTAVHLLAASTAPTMTSSDMLQETPESPLAGDDPYAPPAPAGPTSGTGSGASPSSPSGSAAWLNEFGFDLPLPGSIPASGSLLHAPSPASFDPGSSPD
ncbi:MAG TPA: hypothetical protein VFI36_02000 [Arthrobacter sp.]|nr:hypothetical protein [Arthrobacter sp.]